MHNAEKYLLLVALCWIQGGASLGDSGAWFRIILLAWYLVMESGGVDA